MAKTKQEKKKIISELKEKLEKQKSLVFLNITGLKSDALFNLRNQLKKVGAELKVAKKTLFIIALQKLNFNLTKKDLPGQLAIALGFEDEILPIKTVYNFTKEYKDCKIIGGVFEKKLMKKEEIENIALLPSKKELSAKLLMQLKAPVFNFVFVLRENLRRFLFLLSNLKVQSSK